jgi:hypothetical protein
MAVMVAAIPTAIGWAVEYGGVADVPNLARAMLAVPFGVVVAAVVTETAAGRLR